MSSSHIFTDPASGKTRFFHGYLYECRGDTHYSCPYAVRLNNGILAVYGQGAATERYKCATGQKIG